MVKFLARITADSYEKLRDLDKYHLDLKKRTARQEENNTYTVSGMLTDQQIEQLKGMDYTIEILADLSEVSKNRKQEVSRANRFTKTKGAANISRDAALGGYFNQFS
jgi:murein tripeptide amidase MpaA